ncbi:MAG: Multidrug efflux pump subunit AcrA [Pseudomonas sp.]|nr:MAG: Multidrug efflux pump subunit AcrA [Pseudomonas sp.]
MHRRYVSGMGCITLIALALQGCDWRETTPAPTQNRQVGVITVMAESVEITSPLAGRTVASQTSQVRPQVGGVVTAQLFQEGKVVHAKDPLYQIDPTLYQATADEAVANVALAKASLNAARLRADRYGELAKIDGVSRQDSDDALSTWQQAKATLAANEAALATARANLRYTKVTAPITGRIGRSSITRGALVTASQETELATIQTLDPMHVDLTQASDDYLALREKLAANGEPSSIAVRLQNRDGSYYDKLGTLAFSDISVDPSSGTVTLRAAFPNPDEAILPGLYVRADVIVGTDFQALLVPQGAITRKANGSPQLWVANEGIAEQRDVTLGPALGNRWQVTSGLNPGDRVIIDGVQGLAPGDAVDPVPQS